MSRKRWEKGRRKTVYFSTDFKNRRGKLMKFQKTILLIAILSMVGWSVWSAPANDDCEKAFPLTNLNNWCSGPTQFTNYAATASGIDNPDCFPSYLLDADNDVWFRFKAIATTVNISVIGAIGPGKGTLRKPQLAVYQGSCSGGLRLLACISDATGLNIVETFVNNLTPGQTYYIRIDGRDGMTGSFQLCINNFNPVPSPSSDCQTAMVLCDKSGFTIPQMQGVGRHSRELQPGLCVREESSSAWFKWTCEKSGSLTFTLRPVNPSDDLDFVLFLLPRGVDDCSIKIPVRCMASGENVGEPYRMWQRCSGATGLRSGERDEVEWQGCELDDNNFLAPIQMQAGESYALLVNNFHNTGNGFSVEFGGSGTFAGPNVHFTVSKLKIPEGQPLWVKNASSFSGPIVSWEYNFGVDATPASAKGPGPHKVVYSSPGTKTITLTIETESGCRVSKSRSITVEKKQLPPPSPPPPPPAPKPEPAVESPPPPTNPPSSAEVSESTAEGREEPSGEANDEESAEADTIVSVEETNPDDSSSSVVNYILRFIGTIYFEADSFNLDQDDFQVLDELVNILTLNPTWIAIIEGRANNIPSDEYIRKLASNRSQSVFDYLVRKGIQPQRLSIKTFGKKHWQVRDYSLYSRRKDQRVDVKILERQE